jgi:ABC-2 type transport system permease protein
MRTLASFLVKELLQLRRDPKLLQVLLVAPVIQLIILGYAVTTDIKHVEIAVCDLDRTVASRDLVQRFTSSGYFRVVAYVDVGTHLDRLLQSGEARLGLTIPAGFEARRLNGRAGPVQFVADGSDASTGTIALAYAGSVLEEVAARAGVRPVVDLRPLVLYNPDLKSRNFMVPGTLALIIMTMTMMLTSMALVREAEVGTMEQLLVTPLKPGHIIAGKLLPYALVGFAEVLSALLVVLLWFRVPLAGSLPVLLILTVPFMLCTLGLGLLVSTLSRTQQQAMMLSAFLGMMPQIYLSGFVFPIQNMPKIFQYVTYLVPLRYYVTILRGVFLKGVGIEVLWPHVLALLGIGIVVLGIARARFRQQLA